MKHSTSTDLPAPGNAATSDLVQRLNRYRERLHAAGRPRAVAIIDRAIADASKLTKTCP